MPHRPPHKGPCGLCHQGAHRSPSREQPVLGRGAADQEALVGPERMNGIDQEEEAGRGGSISGGNKDVLISFFPPFLPPLTSIAELMYFLVVENLYGTELRKSHTQRWPSLTF